MNNSATPLMNAGTISDAPQVAMIKPAKVAVVMTVFNGMPYLPEAVQSILGQSLEAFEFFIVDDGSTDTTRKYLQSLDDPRVTLIEQSRTGQQAAAHRAITLATAPYIARMDSDDVASPDRLERQVQYLNDHAEVGLVGSQITRRGQSGSGLLSHFPTDHDAIVEDLLHNRHSMCNPATMFRRQLYFDVGGYWKHNIAEDWDLFLKLADVSKLANLSEPLLSYRFHTGSINGRRTTEAQLYNEYAAKLACLRRDKREPISYEKFLSEHRSKRFPTSVIFHLDCYSIAQYRKAVAEMHSGKPIVGGVRAIFSVMCSPPRLIRRLRGSLASKFARG